MITREQAAELLDDFYRCLRSKPKHNAIGLQIEKDTCEKWAGQLNNLIAWGSDAEVTEAYYQLEPRLKKLKENIVIEVLRHGV
jgi:hypothetical protein